MFCDIVAGTPVGGTRVLLHTPRVSVFRTRSPQGTEHLLVVPRRHIDNTASLGRQHFQLLVEMRVVGHAVLDAMERGDDLAGLDVALPCKAWSAGAQDGAPGVDGEPPPPLCVPTEPASDPDDLAPLLRRLARPVANRSFSFHPPPFNSIDHLHMHTVRLPWTGAGRLLYSPARLKPWAAAWADVAKTLLLSRPPAPPATATEPTTRPRAARM